MGWIKTVRFLCGSCDDSMGNNSPCSRDDTIQGYGNFYTILKICKMEEDFWMTGQLG